jgi:hypothetical protein
MFSSLGSGLDYRQTSFLTRSTTWPGKLPQSSGSKMIVQYRYRYWNDWGRVNSVKCPVCFLRWLKELLNWISTSYHGISLCQLETVNRLTTTVRIMIGTIMYCFLQNTTTSWRRLKSAVWAAWASTTGSSGSLSSYKSVTEYRTVCSWGCHFSSHWWWRRKWMHREREFISL